MNFLFFATLLCVGAVVFAEDDGQWKGEGLIESQDNGQWDHAYGVYGVPTLYAGAYHGVYAHGGAPIGADGHVVDTPEVAHAKAAHFAAKAAATHGAYTPLAYAALPGIYGAYSPLTYAAYGSYAHGGAPIGADGRVVDTPEVAHAKAAHFAAKSAAVNGVYGVPAVYGAYSPLTYAAYGSYAHGGAPIGADGRVVDTPEVAHAKAAHFAAKAHATHY